MQLNGEQYFTPGKVAKDGRGRMIGSKILLPCVKKT